MKKDGAFFESFYEFPLAYEAVFIASYNSLARNYFIIKTALLGY